MDFGKMKIALLVFLAIIASLDLTWSAKKIAKKKPKIVIGKKGKKLPKGTGIKRPGSFTSEVQKVLTELAIANGYGPFDKCHIIPWQFLREEVQKLINGKMTQTDMRSFIGDLGTVHADAGFLLKASKKTKKTYRDLTRKYRTEALKALTKNDHASLIKLLFNMPSNLYPGVCSINRSIGGNIDPPRKGVTNEATKQAKNLFEDYKGDGLTGVEDTSKPKGIWVKSSDNVTGKKGLYVNIEKKDAK